KKLRIQRKFPQVFDFLVSAMQEESAEVKEIIQQKVEPIYGESKNKMYRNIDYDKFSEGNDIEKAIEILNWTMFRLGEIDLSQINTLENISKFEDQYLKDCKSYS